MELLHTNKDCFVYSLSIIHSQLNFSLNYIFSLNYSLFRRRKKVGSYNAYCFHVTEGYVHYILLKNMEIHLLGDNINIYWGWREKGGGENHRVSKLFKNLYIPSFLQSIWPHLFLNEKPENKHSIVSITSYSYCLYIISQPCVLGRVGLGGPRTLSWSQHCILQSQSIIKLPAEHNPVKWHSCKMQIYKIWLYSKGVWWNQSALKAGWLNTSLWVHISMLHYVI